MCTKIIGFGTGRCGTKSLASLLSSQNNTRVTHESRFLAHQWYDDSEITFNQFLSTLQKIPMDFYGDVSFNHLPYIERLVVSSSAIKLIYLEREPDAVIKSFWNWTNKADWKVNHWLKQWDSPGQYISSHFDNLFPKYDKFTHDKLTAIGLYVRGYQREARYLIEKYPDRIFKIKTLQLNDMVKVNEMLDFIGYPEENRVLINIHENKYEA